MNRIYEKAKKVVVFMGEDPDKRAAVVQQLIKEHVERMKPYKSIKEMPVLASDDPVFQDERWTALGVLMSNVWFTRAWVSRSS
jgi:hypothetical protein